MGPAVAVDVPVQTATAERALATCSAALGKDQCALATAGVEARWYAVVRFDPERQAVLLIQLYDGTAGPRVASSQLEFKDRDTEAERWASAGVVVAALVAAQGEAKPAQEPEPQPVPVPAPAPPVAVARKAPARVAKPGAWARVDVGATGGSELANGTLRFGPFARVGAQLSGLPWFVFGSGAYTIRGAGTPDLTWVTGSLGFGAHVGFARERLLLEVRTDAVLESVSIHASDGMRAENASRTRLGPRFGLDFGANFAKNVSFVGGVEAAALRPRVDIDVAGTGRSGLPPFSWGFISAVRYDFR